MIGEIIDKIRRKAVMFWPSLTGYRIRVEWIESIDVEPIASCNLKCPFCQVADWDRADYTNVMSLETFRKVIDQFVGLKSVKIQGMGEPFMNRELPDFISYCTEKGITARVISNGTIMHKTLREKIIDAGLKEIWFSFDGATKTTYESLRLGANYEKVLENIRELCITKREKGAKLKIGMICLVSKVDVLREIPEYVQLAYDIGVRNIHVKNRLKDWKKVGTEGVYVIGGINKITEYEDHDMYLQEARRLAKRLGVHFKIAENSEYSSSDPCPWPWHSCYVSVEGKIVPCCVIGVPETWTMGDLMKEDISTVWNNDLYRQFRKDMRENKIRDLCQACYGHCKTEAPTAEKVLNHP